MNTGAGEINTINRAGMAGAAMVARVVIGTTVFFVNCSGNVMANFFSAVLNSDDIGGKEKVARLLKSGEPLEVYTFTKDKLKLFAEQSKRYGIIYSVVRRDEGDKADGTYDVLIKRSDAGKLSRVLDKIGYSTTKPSASANTISSEENVNKEPDGLTMSSEECRNLVDIMLSPDDRSMGNDVNPDLAAEREPLSAGISPEKRSSVAERMDNIRNSMNSVKDKEGEDSYNNLVSIMLSEKGEKDKNSSMQTIRDESDILMGNVPAGKEEGM